MGYREAAAYWIPTFAGNDSEAWKTTCGVYRPTRLSKYGFG
jgi:hypothetical protein